jgi:protocatechuate 3,4-dioxygenase beta subunit
VQAPNQPVLTTQLYFPDEPANERDGIFHPSLVVAVNDAASEAEQGMYALFNFVLA